LRTFLFSRLCGFVGLAGLVGFIIGSSGCASSAVPYAELYGLVAKAALPPNDDALPAQLNPQLRYLRVDVPGRPPALLVLGYLDPHPEGEIEVWYSSQGEVLKTRQGRIIGTAGLELDWRRVATIPPAPRWQEVTAAGHRYRRLRDEMPGYRQSIASDMVVIPWTGLPNTALAASLPPERARRYQWFREEEANSSLGNPLPAAWYAWGRYNGQAAVVFSQQCLSVTFCLSLQPWPPQDNPA